MSRIQRSRISVLDYEEIWTYIAKDDPQAADRLISNFEPHLALLATMPAMGKQEPDLAPNLRRFPIETFCSTTALSRRASNWCGLCTARATSHPNISPESDLRTVFSAVREKRQVFDRSRS